jgi:hypothetical protein
VTGRQRLLSQNGKPGEIKEEAKWLLQLLLKKMSRKANAPPKIRIFEKL